MRIASVSSQRSVRDRLRGGVAGLGDVVGRREGKKTLLTFASVKFCFLSIHSTSFVPDPSVPNPFHVIHRIKTEGTFLPQISILLSMPGVV